MAHGRRPYHVVDDYPNSFDRYFLAVPVRGRSSSVGVSSVSEDSDIRDICVLFSRRPAARPRQGLRQRLRHAFGGSWRARQHREPLRRFRSRRLSPGSSEDSSLSDDSSNDDSMDSESTESESDSESGSSFHCAGCRHHSSHQPTVRPAVPIREPQPAEPRTLVGADEVAPPPSRIAPVEEVDDYSNSDESTARERARGDSKKKPEVSSENQQ